MSGLKINFFKSNLFGVGVEDHVVNDWANRLQCKVGSLPLSCLGLPLGAKKSSRALWQPVIDRCKAKLSGWKASMLSIGGRITLIKSVLASMPLYFMSISHMPKGVKADLDKIQRNFLWGGSEGRKKLHWVDWNTVCKHKSEGGLGIIDLEIQNRALLTKWIWQYSKEQGSLWRAVIQERNGGRPLELTPHVRKCRMTSKMWKNITLPLSPTNEYFKFLSSGMCMVVGNGHNVLFWQDEWIEGVILKDKFPQMFALASNKTGSVNEFGAWVNGDWRWKINLRRSIFGWERAQWSGLLQMITGIILTENMEDKLVWKNSVDGSFL